MRSKIGSGRRLSALLATAIGLLWLTAAGAAVLWYEYYEAGLALEREGRWEEAAREFRQAAELAGKPSKRLKSYGRNYIHHYDPYFHHARCLVELGRAAEAGELLARSEAAAIIPSAELAALRRRIAELAAAGEPEQSPPEPRPALLSAVSSPSGATVRVDGEVLGATPLSPTPVAAGSHEVVLELPGYQTTSMPISVGEGAHLPLEVELEAAPPALPPVPPDTVPATATEAGRSGSVPDDEGARVGESPVVASTREGTEAVRADSEPAREPPPERSEEEGAASAPEDEPAPGEPGESADLEETGSPAAEPAAGPPGVDLAGTVRWWLPAGLLVFLVAAAVLATFLYRRSRQDSAPTERPTVIMTGGSLGGYELLEVLGRGGMATTYRGRRQRDGTFVALKVPHETLSDPQWAARFVREGKLGEQLHHPCIVRILDAGEEDGRPYMAMELLPGRTLGEELRDAEPPPLRRALEITRAIAEALDYAHAKGVIHRDLKPDNIMILPDGTVKVMDFGVARHERLAGLTSPQSFLGTPLYAAPEMLDPPRIDHRVDLYALGIMLFEILQGAPPFCGTSPLQVLHQQAYEPLPQREELDYEVPEPVWRIIERLCEKAPEDRYPSAELLLVELQRLLRDLPA